MTVIIKQLNHHIYTSPLSSCPPVPLWIELSLERIDRGSISYNGSRRDGMNGSVGNTIEKFCDHAHVQQVIKVNLFNTIELQ